MATIDTIAGVLESNLDIDPATVTTEATFESLGIDSLDMVELICDLEEACEVDFGEPRGACHRGASLGLLTSTRCKRPSRFSRTGAPQPSGCGAFCCLVPCVCAERGPVWARAALPEETCLSPVR